jgi:predicted nucleic acid-binding protein
LGKRTNGEAMALHSRLTEFKMRLLGDRASRATAWKIAVQHGGSIITAEYLAVAKLQADALITIDRNIAKVASSVVPLASLKELTSA